MQRPHAEEHERVAIEAVLESSHRREGLVLGDRQRGDIAIATAFEVTRGGVMDRVLTPPLAVRREGQHPGDESDGYQLLFVLSNFLKSIILQ